MEDQQEIKDWRGDISEPKDILKVKPDTEVVFVFQDEGHKQESQDYGASIVFAIKTEDSDDKKIWYVKANNYTLLAQIKSLGKIEGLKVKVIRKGAKRSDTRYTIEKI